MMVLPETNRAFREVLTTFPSEGTGHEYALADESTYATLAGVCDELWLDYCTRTGHVTWSEPAKTEDGTAFQSFLLHDGWGFTDYEIRRVGDGELLSPDTFLTELLPDGGRIEVRLERKEAA